MKKVSIITAMTLAILMVTALAVTAFAQATPTNNATTSDATTNLDTVDGITTPTQLSNSSSHKHNWKVFGYTENGFTVVCDGCKQQINIPTDALDCEHDLTTKITGSTYHSYECTKCMYSARVLHTFDYLVSEKGHALACIDCGYEQNLAAHKFEVFFDSEKHFSTCVTCGYRKEEKHDFYYGCYDDIAHEKLCSKCGYVAEYRPHDENLCSCGHIKEGTIYGIITDTYKGRTPDDEYEYFATVLVNGESRTFEVTRDVRNDVEEGNFFEMTFQNGVMCEAKKLVDDEGNYDPIIASHMGYDEGMHEKDITVDTVDIYDDVISIYFENNRFLNIYHNVIVYNLEAQEVVDIEDIEGCMIMYYTPEGHDITTILIVE